MPIYKYYTAQGCLAQGFTVYTGYYGTSSQIVFVCFWEGLKTPKKTFRNWLTFIVIIFLNLRGKNSTLILINFLLRTEAATIFSKYSEKDPSKSWKKHPQIILVSSLFQNVAYRLTVYKTGKSTMAQICVTQKH